jgi:hypothetical protein
VVIEDIVETRQQRGVFRVGERPMRFLADGFHVREELAHTVPGHLRPDRFKAREKNGGRKKHGFSHEC